MKKLNSICKFRGSFTAILTIIIAISFITMVSAASDKLATPVLIPKGEPSVSADGTPGNPARHTQFRSLIFKPVPGADCYDVYAYTTWADAEAGTNPVAYAPHVRSTPGSLSGGGTQGTTAIKLEDDEILIDVRLIPFLPIEEGYARELIMGGPAGFGPAGLGDSYFPGDGTGYRTNLKPGQYWFRLQAIDAANPDIASELSAPYADGNAFSIAVGPDEARSILEPLIAAGKLGNTSNADLRIVDLRNPSEISDEGYLRFSESNRFTTADFNTTKEAEAIFGHIDNKDEVTIFILCRGGGRAVTAAVNLANAGYKNVYNMEGINQWPLGLMYDDPTFRFRQAPEGKDGDLGPSTNSSSPEGISYDAEAGAIRWYNIPWAKFNIYAFTSPTQTNAVAMKTLAPLRRDLSGNGSDWRFIRSFGLNELKLQPGTYYIKVQALPNVETPVTGLPETYWGAASKLSDAVEITITADSLLPKKLFDDVNSDNWHFSAVEFALENKLLAGISESEFAPNIDITGNMFLTALYRMAGEPPIKNAPPESEKQEYYTNALIWAEENEITSGFEKHDEPITRVYVAIYLYRYAIRAGYNTELYHAYPRSYELFSPDGVVLPKYTDIPDLNSWAHYALPWAVGEELIQGRSETILAPMENTTRAEAAAILMRFYNVYVK